MYLLKAIPLPLVQMKVRRYRLRRRRIKRVAGPEGPGVGVSRAYDSGLLQVPVNRDPRGGANVYVDDRIVLDDHRILVLNCLCIAHNSCLRSARDLNCLVWDSKGFSFCLRMNRFA